MYSKPVTELIKQRRSIRKYEKQPLKDTDIGLLNEFTRHTTCPYGTDIRLTIIHSMEEDPDIIKKLGTYGFIKNPSAFIVGANKKAEMDMEDFGYVMEKNLLYATDLGIGTCWLGASFRKSRFADAVNLQKDEIISAVIAMGYKAGKKSGTEKILRATAGSDRRKPWNELFFSGGFDTALEKNSAGTYDIPLEMVRLAPSASNYQPWRLVKEINSNTVHFYLQRSKGYGRTLKLMKTADLQRIDMGIAMSHFELAAREAGITGCWEIHDPGIKTPDDLCEYRMSWKEA